LQTLADQRAKFEHAIATLIGVPASNFTVAESATLATPPQVPLVQPSHLLERRPDIASAERAVAAANAQIGIAKAGYFPTLNLGGVYGSDSNNRTLLFSTPALLWSLGLSATQTVFDAGRTQAGVNAAKAANTQAVAAYKQTVLNAFEEVENALSSQKALMDASTSLGVALNSSKTAWSISKTRYEGGASSQLEYLLAQQSYLGYARQDVQNKGQQLINSVVLVKALGGGWSAQPIDAPQAQPAKTKAAGNAANASVGDSAKVK
jgi:NodT family efflux transporter outer membrane factor (OMF) lipoprotein